MPAPRLYLATRKGLFTLAKESGAWDIEKVDFLAEPVTMMLPDSRDGALYAALNLGHFGVKLHRSDDQGQTWRELSVPAFPEVAEGEDKKGSSLFQIWALEQGGADKPGVLWAGAIPAGLFRSEDRGETWTLNEPLWDLPQRQKWFGGGYDQAGIHSVRVHPHNSDHLTLAISCGGVWVSEDGGRNWEVRTKGMFAAYMPPEQANDPDIQDPHLLAQCHSAPDHLWVQHHNGIFHSTDAGREWEALIDIEPSSFGFAVAVHPKDPDTAWFVPAVKDETRVPRDGKLVVNRTRDGGKTFEPISSGLPVRHCYDLIYRHALDVDSSGEILAMGSTTGNLWISENGGDTWSCYSHHLPPIYAVRFAKGDGN